MKPELIMLGTGNAMVTKCYNTCFALRNEEEYFLVDAGGGNGILSQLEKAQIPFEQIRHMFLTHAHTDHILGAVWIIRKAAAMMLAETYQGRFTIYCHDEAAKVLREICELTLAGKFLKFLGSKIRIQEVKDGEGIPQRRSNLDFERIWRKTFHWYVLVMNRTTAYVSPMWKEQTGCSAKPFVCTV